ncbi:ABC transporter ATP-binding protein [Lactobacillus delbrueckii]|uniref:ABC transporter ATP-binding protein n=1 Tax=Lactobacillus delbrueckii TaxID=1584 RepID=UPI001C706B29|nr:ABC transporter ATP-binding protein [Lactobacillus delbrueckii]MBW9308112.1 ABC transporter ATP-binding protein [Lactobacillus delbrueckii]
MKILLPYFKRYKKDVFLTLITIVFSAFATLYQPRLLQQVQNELLADQQQAVIRDTAILIGLGLLSIITGVLNVYYASRITQGVVSDLREDTYAKIQTFSLANVQQFSSESLSVRLINDMQQIMNMIMTIFMQLIRMPLILIGSIIMAIVTIPRYWWAVVVLLALIMGLGVVAVKQITTMFDKFQMYMDKISGRTGEFLQGVRVVKSFNQSPQEIAKLNKDSDELNEVNIKVGYWFSTILPGAQLISYLVISLVVYLIGTSILQHPQDVSVITPYVNYVLTMLFAILLVGMAVMQISRGNVSLRRIQEIMDTQPDVVFNEKAPEDALGGSIEFDDVSFTYPDGQHPVLKHISFAVAPGQMVGIVGATGSGKSTLAQLIARLYDPTTGKIKIGGSDLRQVNENALRKTVSYVLQKAVLFSGTIADNLRQGKKDATPYELERAAQMAQANEFIQRYDETFDHEVEERSANFSGGQKQRLSIARGVIAGSPILILDDSTSALDAESEKLVQEALEKQLPDTTTIMIAEKIVSVMHADKILVLDNGRLVAEGTHEELLKTSPVYQEIYKTQKAKERKEEL